MLARDFSDGSLFHVGLLLVLDTHASSEGFLLNFVGLTSHGGLVAKELGRLQENAIDGDSHTVVDHNDVTNVELVVMGNLNFAGAENIADVLLVGLSTRFDELELFLPVDERADASDDHDSDKNRSSLDPSMLALVGVSQDHIESDGERSTDEQDLKHDVVHGLVEDGPEGLGLKGFALVVAEVSCALREVCGSQTSVNV